MDILSTVINTQLGNIFLISLSVSVIFFIINIFINDVFFDLLCGLTYSILFGSTIGLFLGETKLTDNIYIYASIFFGLYLFFMFITYNYINKMAEQSNNINKKDFEGEIATVITTIPDKGMGEVLITASMQKVAMPAKIYRDSNNSEITTIAQGEKVLVITSDNPYVEVIPYKPMFN